MKRTSLFLVAVLALAAPSSAQTPRVPGDDWMRYADPAEAGWSSEKLAEAKAYWDTIGSAAWVVVENGVVVVAWGDYERRYMCHSVRKSFMSGLYGLHVDAGTIDTEKTLADLGIDDEPKLTEVEKRARIEDLLRARSGVYKLAAYEPPQNPKPERGTYEPETFWCYNNFDFNTLCTIFEQETGKRVFEEFDARFARPLGMQDFRVRDGYYHYELDKSIHPAYPFRLSARDCARYGLLFLNEGAWGDERILSEEWVRRSTTSYSDTGGGGGGYGYMWWTFDDPSSDIRGYRASGVGGQSIVVIPSRGLVMVNRTDTYMGRNVGSTARLRLIAMTIDAQAGAAPTDAPRLVALESSHASIPKRESERLARYVGTYEAGGEDVEIRVEEGVLVLELPAGGAFALAPVLEGENDGKGDVFLIEDIELHVLFARTARDGHGELIAEYDLHNEFSTLLDRGDFDDALSVAERALELFPMSAMSHVMLGQIFGETGDSELARGLIEAALELDPEHDEARALARELER